MQYIVYTYEDEEIKITADDYFIRNIVNFGGLNHENYFIPLHMITRIERIQNETVQDEPKKATRN